MPLFKKKEESQQPAAATAAPSESPVDIVVQMRQQGYSNNQIIQYLTDQGYSSAQVFDAMSQADIGKAGGPVEETAPAAEMHSQPETNPQMPEQQPAEMPPPPAEEPPSVEPAQIPEMPAPGTYPQSGITREDVEEIAESIIEEKWTDLMKSVEKVIQWKDTTEAKINKIQESIKDLKERFEDLHKGVLERVSEYDKGIKQVGVNVKAMEEVFKKLLPQFTENVSELSRITKKAKSKR